MSGEHRARTAGSGPAYLAVAEDLRSRILHGEYGPDASLPDDQTLADRYGVPATVIRNAVGLLYDWRLIGSAQRRNVLPLPKALFDGIVLGWLRPDHPVTEELLALDPRYVVLNRADDDHLRFLIERERIPLITTSPSLIRVPEPARWLNVVLRRSDEETTLDTGPTAGCTLLIHTDLLPPQAAARSIHALAMA